MRILFQGDSITDAGRNYNDPANLGMGYPKYTAELLRQAYPDTDFEFINRGISGHRALELMNRWDEDAIDLQPDVVSILIGINDTWHQYSHGRMMSHEDFETYYRTILERLKKETSAKILILEQFLLPAPDKLHFHEDLDPKIQITRKLAREYADAFVPLDGLFAAACVTEPWENFSGDGVHPNGKGSAFIAEHYLAAFRQIMDAKDPASL